LLDSLLQELQKKKISWVPLDLAPVVVEVEVVVAVVEEGEDSPPEVEAEVASHPEVAVVVEEIVVEEEGEAVVVAEGVAEEWEPGRKLSSSLTDTPGSSLPEGRRTLW